MNPQALQVIAASLAVVMGGTAFAIAGRGAAAASPGGRDRDIGPAGPAAPPRALRAIATMEALKGLVALAALLGLLSLLHRDLHHLAAAFIGHVGLDPGGHYPAMVLREVDVLAAADRRSLTLAAGGYAIVRTFEACGLWRGRVWGEWLGALSGALYLPFELRHFLHRPTLAIACVMAFNLAVVGYLTWLLWRSQRGTAH